MLWPENHHIRAYGILTLSVLVFSFFFNHAHIPTRPIKQWSRPFSRYELQPEFCEICLLSSSWHKSKQKANETQYKNGLTLIVAR